MQAATGTRYDTVTKRWVAPFFMASFNTRIVRRSNALRVHAYGRGFRYSEVMGVGRSPVARQCASRCSVHTTALGRRPVSSST